jgi:mannose-1-phosphate guanylyltransferase
MRYVVIMAGGSGKRLWPLSRRGMPKQMLHLVGDTSLLRLAFNRVVGVVGAEQVWVCTGTDYTETVHAELPELPERNILGEPIGRDSLNAIAWPAAVLAAEDPEAVIAVVTADQIMQPVEAFQDALRTGFEVAEADPTALVTFGVVPNSPHTGYGYLYRGRAVSGHSEVFEVVEFEEKPNRTTAEA